MDNQNNDNVVDPIQAENTEAEIQKEDTVVVTPTEQDQEHHHSEHHHDHHSHHHSHHSSHHGSHHSKKRRRSSSEKKKKLKVNRKIATIIAVSLLAVLLVVTVMTEVLNVCEGDCGADYDETINGESSRGILSVQVINEDGVLIKEAVRKYILTDMLNPYNTDIKPSDLSQDEGRLDAQVPVSLKLSANSATVQSYRIELADNEKFENATVSYFEASSGIYEFKHLCVNTLYFYRVTVFTNKGADSLTGTFKTADTPRILSIDGISNVRDIGNWKTDSGKRIKQGLLIRGTELDGAVESTYHLTNDGLMDMLNVLGIKTDIDLRGQSSITKDALGSQVEHRYYGVSQYEGIFTEEGKEKIRMVFSDLSNPDNYPIYLHCTYGCDRTGTVCYLLEALLGVSRGDCLKEYGLSNLNISNIQKIETALQAYEGDSLKEQTESYLISCGISEYQIESIRQIFLGE